MSSRSFKLRLPDVIAGDPARRGFAVVFHRTRFTIQGVRLEPAVRGMSVRILHDRGVLVTVELPPEQRDYQLTVHVVGQPVVVRDQYLIVAGEDQPKPGDGWVYVLEGAAEAELQELADPRREIRELRAALLLLLDVSDAPPSSPRPLAAVEAGAEARMADDPSPPLQRLFFLRVDELTRVETLDPARLPVGVAPADAIVLEALRVDTLTDGLASWVKELQDTGNEFVLTYGVDYTPNQWIQAMATYLKSVFEVAFAETFGRPLATATSGALALDNAFALAFEDFANGALGDNNGIGVPTTNTGVPDSAYFFSFAAFAWMAKTKARTADEKAFWKAVWPVFAYTAEIYRRRYTPTVDGGQYAEYSFEKPKTAVDLSDMPVLRASPMTKIEFRKILQAACSGC